MKKNKLRNRNKNRNRNRNKNSKKIRKKLQIGGAEGGVDLLDFDVFSKYLFYTKVNTIKETCPTCKFFIQTLTTCSFKKMVMIEERR